MDSKYPEDEEILRRLRAGDSHLLKELHQSYWQSFGPYFLKRKDLNKEEVLDIYASAFTRFYFNIREQKIIPPLRSSLKSYLIGIGKNFMLRLFEQKNRNKETSMDNLEVIPRIYQNPAVDDWHKQKALKELIKKLLLQLEADCQQLIRLSFLEENADDAIAQKMNIPSSGAVRQRRFKCLEKLRKLFKN